MKIGIIVPIVGNFGRKGFYHSQEIGLGKTMASYGDDVIVYKCVPEKSMKQISIEHHDDITIKYIPTKAIGPHGMLNIANIDKDLDVAFVFSDTQLIIPTLYQFCKRNNIKFIPYVGIAHSFQQNLKSKIMDILFKFTTLRVYKKVTVVAKTIDAKKELENQGVKRCEVAPVGMDFSALKENYESFDRTEIRKKWGFTSDAVIVSFVARMQPEKRPLEMIDIFARIQKENKKLLMVGKGPLETQIHKKVQNLGIEDKVVFLPEVKYSDMWQIHYISDYFVNLRSEEIFGMAVMEAVYYQSCVVAIKAPGPNTILKGMQGHYLCDNFDEVVEVIEDRKVDYNNLKKSKEYLQSNFSWNICADIINQIAGD